MKGVSLEFANIPTPIPSSSSEWTSYSEKERIDIMEYSSIKISFLYVLVSSEPTYGV